MQLSELCSGESRLFAKSEFQPASDRWPALSFSSRKVASDFANEYRRGRDFVIYVGTSDPKTTENPAHRQRLMSAISVEPRTPVSTRELISTDAWERAVNEYGIRWEWSLPILASYDFAGFPRAHEEIPATYAALGAIPNRGRCVEITGVERTGLLALNVTPVTLQLSARAQTVMDLNTDKALRQELSRLVAGIKHDVAIAGLERIGIAPERNLPNDSDVFLMLNRRWREQKGLCPLCGHAIPLKPANRLLQMSRDRTDSGNKTYDWHNTRLTHLACNLGKSDGTLDEWHEYLALIRSLPNASPNAAAEL
jgi:hypothetical protein